MTVGWISATRSRKVLAAIQVPDMKLELILDVVKTPAVRSGADQGMNLTVNVC